MTEHGKEELNKMEF